MRHKENEMKHLFLPMLFILAGCQSTPTYKYVYTEIPNSLTEETPKPTPPQIQSFVKKDHAEQQEILFKLLGNAFTAIDTCNTDKRGIRALDDAKKAIYSEESEWK